jgi:hypothetical protein
LIALPIHEQLALFIDADGNFDLDVLDCGEPFSMCAGVCLNSFGTECGGVDHGSLRRMERRQCLTAATELLQQPQLVHIGGE